MARGRSGDTGRPGLKMLSDVELEGVPAGLEKLM
jgi:hypothetical protein